MDTYIHICIHTHICIKKYIVLLKKIKGKKCDELKFEITGLLSNLKASPSLWICFEIIWFENVCILKEAMLFLLLLPQNTSVCKIVNLTR